MALALDMHRENRFREEDLAGAGILGREGDMCFREVCFGLLAGGGEGAAEVVGGDAGGVEGEPVFVIQLLIVDDVGSKAGPTALGEVTGEL